MIIFLMLAVSELNLLNCSCPPAASLFQSSLFVLVLTISVSAVYPFTIISLFLSDSQNLIWNSIIFQIITNVLQFMSELKCLHSLWYSLHYWWDTSRWAHPKNKKQKNSLEENISYFSKIKIQKNINLLTVPLS